MIARLQCGPPESANGGYTAGLLAAALTTHGSQAAVEVSLLAPPPLERPLAIVTGPAGTAVLLDDDVEVATARTVDFEPPQLPHRVSFADAEALAPTSVMVRSPELHPFPGCFVCGPDRAPGDGLRLFPAEVPGARMFVAPYRPRAEHVAMEYVWAALDCPSSFPMYEADDPFPGPLVLGRMVARIVHPLEPGEPLVVASWRTGAEGRKLSTAVVLHDDSGRVLAAARAIWIRLRPTP